MSENEKTDIPIEDGNEQKATENEEDTIKDQVQPEEPKSEKPEKKSKRKKSSKKDEVEDLKQELGEMKEKYVRLYAEYDNFRRRTAKEKVELGRSGSSRLILDILPVLDDTERALGAIDKSKANKEVRVGTELIRNKLFAILEKNGLVAMDSKGKDFDTDHHEAITQFPTDDESMKGKVIDVVEKGYFLHDKVLRFAKVVVGS